MIVKPKLTLVFSVVMMLIGCNNSMVSNLIGDVPESASVTHHEVVTQGIDSVHFFEIKRDPTELLGILQKRFSMIDVGVEGKPPFSLAEGKRPKWWPKNWSPRAIMLTATDFSNERYESLWCEPEGQFVYLEIGQW